MKKLFTFLLSLLMVFSLTACGESKKLKDITVVYNGSTEEGTEIKAEDFDVTAEYDDESTEKVKDFTIEKGGTLEVDETLTVTIKYEDKEKEYDIKCTTTKKLSKSEVKKLCKTIKYKELFRNPDKYKGNYYKFTGEVTQVMEDGQLRMYVTNDGYGYYDDDILVVYDEDVKILEDDIITIYAMAAGNYTYETVMGNSREVPLLYAVYYDVKS